MLGCLAHRCRHRLVIICFGLDFCGESAGDISSRLKLAYLTPSPFGLRIRYSDGNALIESFDWQRCSCCLVCRGNHKLLVEELIPAWAFFRYQHLLSVESGSE